MRLMALEAIYPKPRLSFNATEHTGFPYLLRALQMERSNQTAISMDGRGRVFDTFSSSSSGSLKYEGIYLRNYESPTEVQRGINQYCLFYNDRR